MEVKIRINVKAEELKDLTTLKIEKTYRKFEL